jgi:steroid 5-alpha reductase family enzyme
MGRPRLSRVSSLVVLCVAYLFALAAAAAVVDRFSDHGPLAAAAIADLIATLLVFAFSRALDNSSVYDPYWSVAPIAMAVYWAWPAVGGQPIGWRALIVAVLVAIWGVRLTANFLTHWRGLDHEDWRYADFRRRTGGWYWLVSLFGFHLFPTVIVFVACIPVYSACTARGDLGGLDLVAAIVTLAAIVIEAVADRQMRRAAPRADGATFRRGLWAVSRHPNYFGEILFWWGLYLFALAADLKAWWTIVGPLGVSVLFVTVSIPLIETRMLRRRPDYERVRAEVSMLIPWFPKQR